MRDSAQTWEQQALTRARVVAGDAALAPPGRGARLDEPGPAAARPTGLAAGGSRHARADLQGAWQRRSVEPEACAAAPWSRSSSPCSISSCCTRSTARDCARPACASCSPRSARHGLLPVDEAQAWPAPTRLHQALQAVLRLSLSDRFDPKAAPPRLLEALVAGRRHRPRRASPRRPISRRCSGRSLKASARRARSSTNSAPATRRRTSRQSREAHMSGPNEGDPAPGIRAAGRRRRPDQLDRARGQALRDLLLPQGRHARLHQAGDRVLLHLRPVQDRRRRGDRRVEGQRRQPRQVQEEARAGVPLGLR